MKRMKIELDGTILAEAVLFEEKAPDIVAALWSELPFTDRTIQVRWSGNAWRTEKQHQLVPYEHDVENPGGDGLVAGDVIYTFKTDNPVVGFCYGEARWPRKVAVIGKIDRGLEDFVKRSKRVIFDGPLTVKLSRIE